MLSIVDDFQIFLSFYWVFRPLSPLFQRLPRAERDLLDPQAEQLGSGSAILWSSFRAMSAMRLVKTAFLYALVASILWSVVPIQISNAENDLKSLAIDTPTRPGLRYETHLFALTLPSTNTVFSDEQLSTPVDSFGHLDSSGGFTLTITGSNFTLLSGTTPASGGDNAVTPEITYYENPITTTFHPLQVDHWGKRNGYAGHHPLCYLGNFCGGAYPKLKTDYSCYHYGLFETSKTTNLSVKFVFELLQTYSSVASVLSYNSTQSNVPLTPTSCFFAAITLYPFRLTSSNVQTFVHITSIRNPSATRHNACFPVLSIEPAVACRRAQWEQQHTLTTIKTSNGTVVVLLRELADAAPNVFINTQGQQLFLHAHLVSIRPSSSVAATTNQSTVSVRPVFGSSTNVLSYLHIDTTRELTLDRLNFA